MGKNREGFGEVVSGGNNLRILLIGDFSENYDEGLKNIAKYFYEHLCQRNEVKKINVKDLFVNDTYSIIIDFDPDIIHYFTGPTCSSLVLLKALSIRWPHSKTIISALHPRTSVLSRNYILRRALGSVAKANILLYQDNSICLTDLSSELIYLPNGVNTNKFKPASKVEKDKLRKKYGVDESKFVLTHVGHLFQRRNLELLIELQRNNPSYQVVIVAGTYVARDIDLLEKLRQSGCTVITGYLEHVEDVYRLSDCYIFPVLLGNSISLPLSVLEAMACNLPVISMNYPALSTFSNVEGFYLVEEPQEIISTADKVYIKFANGERIDTRQEVLPYSWENVVADLENIYLNSVGESYE